MQMAKSSAVSDYLPMSTTILAYKFFRHTRER